MLFDFEFFSQLKEKIDKTDFKIATYENTVLQLNRNIFDLKECVF
jgi:hypothetical protein